MFSNKTNSSVKFARFNAATGKFIVDCKAQTEGAVEVKPGKWQLQFDAISGLITRIQHTEDTNPQGELKQIVRIRFKDPDGLQEDALVTFTVSALSVAKMLGALNAADLRQPVRLVGSFFAAGSTKIGTKDLDKPLESDQVFLSVFTEEGYVHPNFGSRELPKAVEHKIGNRKVYDSSEREKFTLALIEHLATVVSKLQENARPAASSATPAANAPSSASIPEGFGGNMPADDDLPPTSAYENDFIENPFASA